MSWRWLAAWVAVAAAEAFLFLYDYRSPPRHPSVLTALQHPIDATTYVLGFLGSPLVPIAPSFRVALPVGVILGVLILLAFALAHLFVFRAGARRQALLRLAAPWLTLGWYSILTAGMVMVGRVGFGTNLSLSSRYLAFSLYLVVALLWLGLIYFQYRARQLQPDRADGVVADEASRPAKTWAISLTAALVGVTIATLGFSLWEMEAKRRGLLYDKASILLIDHLSPRVITELSNRWAIRNVSQTINDMNRLDLLRPSLIKDRDILSAAPQGRIPVPNHGSIDKMETAPNGDVLVRGWAALPERGLPADAVALTYRDSAGRFLVFEVFRVGLTRPDIVEKLGSRSFFRSGWSGTIKLTPEMPQSILFDAWAIDSRSRKAYRVSTSARYVRPGSETAPR